MQLSFEEVQATVKRRARNLSTGPLALFRALRLMIVVDDIFSKWRVLSPPPPKKKGFSNNLKAMDRAEGPVHRFRALRANISLISIHWWFCCLCLKNEKCDIVGWRAFLNRFVLFLLQKFNTYTTPKDGMEIWVHCNFYTPLLRSGGTDSRIQNLWWRPSGPWLKLWVGGCIHLEKCDIT